MKKVLLASLLLPLVLTLPVFAKSDGPGNMSEVKPLFSCMLNKSETLEVYENKVDGNYQLTLETRNFLENLGEGYMINLSKSKIQSLDFGNTMMFTYNVGRSGYLFLRIEKNSKPHPEDVGNITVLMDNSLFNERDHALYTGGKLVALSDCTWRN